MKSQIKRILEYFKIIDTIKLVDDTFYEIGEGTIMKSFNINVRIKKTKKFLSVGRDSIISGNYVFENENGKVVIGDRTFIGGGHFIAIDRIEIGDDVLISWGCTFMDNNAHSINWKERKTDVRDWKKGIEEGKIGHYKNWQNVKSASIKVKNKAWIGFNSIILKGVTIGEGAIVGSGSVVSKDVPDWTIVAGNPAQIVRVIAENER